MKRRWVIIITLLTTLWVHNHVFAQDCPVCDMPPPHLQIYEWVMDELIGYIATTPKTPPEWNVWNIWLAITSALDASLTSLTIARILPVQVLSDLFGWVQLLAGSQTMVRDRETLLRIDRRIGLQTLSMVQASRNTDSIPDSVLVQIDASLQKLGFVKLKKNAQGKYIMRTIRVNGATYGDLASLLWQLNFMYKQIHLNKWYHPLIKDVGAGYRKTDKEQDDGWSRSFDPEDLQRFILSTNAIVDQTFAPLYGFFRWPTHERLDFWLPNDEKNYINLYLTIWEVQKQYECSLGLKSDCSERKELREESLTLAKDHLINDGNNAIKTFKDAWWRLKWALGGWSAADQKAAQQRKQALLYSQRWPIAGEEKRRLLDVDTHIEPVPQTVSSLRKSLTRVFQKKANKLWQDEQPYPNSSQPSTQPIANSQKDAQLYNDDPYSILQEQINTLADQPKDKFTQEWIGLKNTKGQIVLEQQTQRLQQSFLSVLWLQEAMQQESIFTDVNRTTHRFPLLSATVYKNIDIIGTKNDNGMLYNAMGTVCDQQCSNLGPTCRYITQ